MFGIEFKSFEKHVVELAGQLVELADAAAAQSQGQGQGQGAQAVAVSKGSREAGKDVVNQTSGTAVGKSSGARLWARLQRMLKVGC